MAIAQAGIRQAAIFHHHLTPLARYLHDLNLLLLHREAHTYTQTRLTCAMFSTKLTRAAHRATTSSTAAISNHTSTTCISCLTTQRPNHQRRQSSSKTSCPPDNTSSKPAPTAKASASEESEKVQASSLEQQPSQSRSGKGRSRGGYKKVGQVDNASKKAVPAEPIDQFAGLPSVPSIQNVDARGMYLLCITLAWHDRDC